MSKFFILVTIAVGFIHNAIAQEPLKEGTWRALLHRNDSQTIVFNYRLQWQNQKPIVTIINADEKIRLEDINVSGDSVIARMPVFESEFHFKIITSDSISGEWIKGTAGKNQVVPFTATSKQSYRFVAAKGKAQHDISGKWSVNFFSDKSTSPAIAVLTQKGDKLTGSILTPTGDYRYLQGIVTGDSLLLSAFDGVHALLFTGTIKDSHIEGSIYSSLSPKRNWKAVWNDTATLPDLAAMHLKDPDDNRLQNFRFPDLDGKMVSLADPQFKNKVVVIQLMGSWCPNCMDETAFMSEWYKKNHQRGVAMIGLAYEYTTNLERSQKSLRKFQQRFAVDYPILITPVSVTDTLRTEKTLPQFTTIKTFPTTIILDKQGRVRKIETDFFGPGTGIYYQQFIQAFDKTINELLSE